MWICASPLPTPPALSIAHLRRGRLPLSLGQSAGHGATQTITLTPDFPFSTECSHTPDWIYGVNYNRLMAVVVEDGRMRGVTEELVDSG